MLSTKPVRVVIRHLVSIKSYALEVDMKEYIPVIASVIAGVSAMASALIAWKLKNSSDSAREKSDRAQRKHEELKLLYTGTFQLFEEAIRQVFDRSDFTLAKQFSENNARIHLLAPKEVADKYLGVSCLLESWSKLHAKASPRQTKFGDQVVEILQSPDPTVKYKEPAKAEHEKLQLALGELVDLMRGELDAGA